MKKLLLASCLLISACSSPLEISSRPVDRPTMSVPELTPTVQRPVEWAVVNRENLNTRLGTLEPNSVVFVLDSQGYQDLNINIADLRRYIIQQRAIIQALRQYYERPSNVTTE
jgi:hypothetical protein